MKKECEQTQAMLPRYLKGHVFLLQQRRVERHLASCAVCRSRYDSLRQADETRDFLRYLDGNEGFSGRLQTVISAAKRLLFRPLRLALIVVALLALQRFVISPMLHDPDLEKLDAGPLQQSAPTPTAHPASEPAVPAAPPAAAPAAAAVDPLQITITVPKDTEKASIARINEAMKEHALLKSLRFSDKVREIAGSLTPDELMTFFNRIQDAGKVTYRRKRLAAAGGELLPFVMKLQTQAAPPAAAAERPAPKPSERPADKPVEKTAGAPVEHQAPVPASPSPAAAPQPQQAQ